MKNKVFKRILSTAWVLVIAIGLVSLSALTSFAAEPTEIDEIELYFRSESDLPVVGEPIVKHTTAMKTDDPYIQLTGDSLYWNIDDSSVMINDTFADHGMDFEAGRRLAR